MAQKAGFLTKEGGSIKTWKKRWCVLKNGTLSYSKNQVRKMKMILMYISSSHETFFFFLFFFLKEFC